jgi:hypothetical protein
MDKTIIKSSIAPARWWLLFYQFLAYIVMHLAVHPSVCWHYQIVIGVHQTVNLTKENNQFHAVTKEQGANCSCLNKKKNNNWNGPLNQFGSISIC